MLAFSGGGDSVCLLHQARCLIGVRELLAVHVDHGLDRDSPRRADRARELAAQLGVSCRVETVSVPRAGSIEAQARRARYAALSRHLGPGGVLLTAHHADDVAETMLLRLLRGAGLGGLSGIARQRTFAGGYLVRPLLGWTRAAIERYLAHHRLDWINDPANALTTLDRNYIRHAILPLLKSRFPGAVGAINRSARLNQAALKTLAPLIQQDLAEARRPGARLDWSGLDALDDFRRTEAIRLWCLEQGHAPPPGPRLDELLRQVASCADDCVPQIRWDGACLRFWRQCLWLENLDSQAAPSWCLSWGGQAALALPPPSGSLSLQGEARLAFPDLSVRSAQAGERIRLPGRACHHRIKQLMQARGIPPWQRAHWPRLYSGERLLAVGNLWLDAAFADQLDRAGLRLDWDSPLYRP